MRWLTEDLNHAVVLPFSEKKNQILENILTARQLNLGHFTDQIIVQTKRTIKQHAVLVHIHAYFSQKIYILQYNTKLTFVK